MKPNLWVVCIAVLCSVAAFVAPLPARADSMYVTAAGAGGGPHVKVFRSSDNAPVGSFFAYASTLTTGVRVAICQQGTRHVVFTAPGPGSPSHVRAFDAVSGAVLAETFAWPINLVTGFYVACGDFFADGGLSVAVAPDGGGGPHVKVFRMVGNSLVLQREWFAYDASFRGGVRLAAGHFGTNHDLLVTVPGPGGGPHLRKWEVATVQEVAGFFVPVTDLQGLPFPAYSAGLFVTRLPDVSGDGQDDIAVSYTNRLVFRRPSQANEGNPFIVSPNYAQTGVFIASGGIRILSGPRSRCSPIIRRRRATPTRQRVKSTGGAARWQSSIPWALTTCPSSPPSTAGARRSRIARLRSPVATLPVAPSSSLATARADCSQGTSRRMAPCSRLWRAPLCPAAPCSRRASSATPARACPRRGGPRPMEPSRARSM
jgi:hypothetical protein